MNKPVPKPADKRVQTQEEPDAAAAMPAQVALDPAAYGGPTNTSALIDYRVRTYRGESRFVIGSWIDSYYGAPGVRAVPPAEYRDQHSRLATTLLDRGVCFVAEHPKHDTYLGFVLGERYRNDSIVHYVYVKHWARRHGIGNKLLDTLLGALRPHGGSDGNVRYTHVVNGPWAYMTGRRRWHYSPYPAFRKGWEG